MRLLRQLFGNAQGVSAALHLRIHFGWIDVRAVPEHDEVVCAARRRPEPSSLAVRG